MIALRELTLARGERVLLESASLTLHRGQRVGIVGGNGAGKSSLFALLRGELQADAGTLDLPPRLAIAHVAQETPAAPCSGVDYVLDGDAELRDLERQIARAGGNGTDLAELYARLDAIDGFTARARVGQLLSGLGFSPAQAAQPVSALSGGWRMRLNLARALAARCDLLLLDEPTNHLDLEALVWLEQWLASYRGTLLLISHDRDFLDATVTAICHLHDRSLRLYTGNYAAFERARAAELCASQAAYERQQRERMRLQSFIDRFRAKATKARQAQSRMKALERMELVSAVHADSGFSFSFEEPGPVSNPLLTLEQVSAGFEGAAPVLRDINLTIEQGMRVGLLGQNGAGKSTLVQTLAGALAPLAGHRQEAKGLKVGYFAQHQFERLRDDESALAHLMRTEPNTREQALRTYLGGFGFAGEAALKPVGLMSGGEKSRLLLALLVRERPHLLLLDEPTNHLDLAMRQALSVALQAYAGALVVVSHDRHLLRATADHLLWVVDGQATWFDGDLDDYRDALSRRAEDHPAAPPGEPGQADRKLQKRQEAEERNRRSQARRPLESRIQRLETEMAQLNGEQSAIEAQLADETTYREEAKSHLQDILVRRGDVLARLAALEDEWLAATEALDALAQAAPPL